MPRNVGSCYGHAKSGHGTIRRVMLWSRKVRSWHNQAGQVKTLEGLFMLGQDRPRSGQIISGQSQVVSAQRPGLSGQVRIGQGRLDHVLKRLSQVMEDQDRSGEHKLGNVRSSSGHGRSGQVRPGQVSP